MDHPGHPEKSVPGRSSKAYFLGMSLAALLAVACAARGGPTGIALGKSRVTFSDGTVVEGGSFVVESSEQPE